MLKAKGVELGLSVSATLEKILRPEESPKEQRGSGRVTAQICLAQMSKLVEFGQYLFCPQHPGSKLKCKIEAKGQTFEASMKCPLGNCQFNIVGSDATSNKANVHTSSSNVSNQLIFAATTINISYGEYERFCFALTLPPLSESAFNSFRTTSLKQFDAIWVPEEVKYQSFCQQIGDRHCATDASFSQRRDAESCFVTFMTIANNFVVKS